MIIDKYVKKGEDLVFSPTKDVSIFNQQNETNLSQKKYKEKSALALSKHYNHTVVYLEKGEHLDEVYSRIIKAAPLGLYIVKLMNGKIIDYIFKDRNYNFYNKKKSDCSKRMLAGHKRWNASKKFKVKMMVARERSERWYAYISQ